MEAVPIKQEGLELGSEHIQLDLSNIQSVSVKQESELPPLESVHIKQEVDSPELEYGHIKQEIDSPEPEPIQIKQEVDSHETEHVPIKKELCEPQSGHFNSALQIDASLVKQEEYEEVCVVVEEGVELAYIKVEESVTQFEMKSGVTCQGGEDGNGIKCGLKEPIVPGDACGKPSSFLGKLHHHLQTSKEKPPVDRRTVQLDEYVQQYPPGVLQTDGSKILCTTCNKPLSHKRKLAIDRHLTSQKHVKRKAKIDGDEALLSSLKRRGKESYERRHAVIYDLTEAFVCADIPLEKLDHPKLREFFNKHVINAGAIPTAGQMRREYLPKITNLHKNKEIN